MRCPPLPSALRRSQTLAMRQTSQGRLPPCRREYKRRRLADALVPQTFIKGAKIITQGSVEGVRFHIIERGTVRRARAPWGLSLPRLLPCSTSRPSMRHQAALGQHWRAASALVPARAWLEAPMRPGGRARRCAVTRCCAVAGGCSRRR